MADDLPGFPGQEELEKELSEYLSKKYGYRIKVISPMMMPQTKDLQETTQKSPGGSDKIKFDMKPEELENYLNQYAIKQENAKAVLATKICTHYNRIRFQQRRTPHGNEPIVGRIKNNILLIGPTGVGKTFLVKLIAQKLGVPFVKGDATKFSETGYVGGDVEDLVRELLIDADDDVERAQHGIIYIDEIDKIASSQHLLGRMFREPECSEPFSSRWKKPRWTSRCRTIPSRSCRHWNSFGRPESARKRPSTPAIYSLSSVERSTGWLPS